MIEYVEIREKSSRQIIGVIDTAQSVIWKSLYYGVGDFEIYVEATPHNIVFLSEGNYVTRPDNYECGIIEHIEITEDGNDGKMIIASGRFIKSILSRRIIYSATLVGTEDDYIWSCTGNVLKGKVETAVRKLISDNAINATDENRNISEIYWTDDDISGITDIIVTEDSSGELTAAEKQVTYKNLLEYSDGVLQEYQCGAKMWIDRERLKFRYKVFKGVDRSRDSTTNQPLIFSKEFDNLTSTNYIADNTAHKTTALIAGDGEGLKRKCAFSYAWFTGLERIETFIDASNISSTYKGEDDTEQTYTNEVYRKMLEAQGRQTIAEMQKVETFDGEIDLTNTNLLYGTDYNLGDMITIEDKDLRKYINARITTVTEVQDENGYKINIEYGI